MKPVERVAKAWRERLHNIEIPVAVKSVEINDLLILTNFSIGRTVILHGCEINQLHDSRFYTWRSCIRAALGSLIKLKSCYYLYRPLMEDHISVRFHKELEDSLV